MPGDDPLASTTSTTFGSNESRTSAAFSIATSATWIVTSAV